MGIKIRERIRRYQRWLDRAPVDRPLVGLIWEPDIPPLPEFLDIVGDGIVLSPDQVEPELFLPYLDTWHQRDSEWTSDVIQSFSPAFGIPWVEAIAGCPIITAPGSLWAEPYLDNLSERSRIRFDPKDPWLRKLVEFTQAMVQFADGRFPIALPQMRGPLDTLAAMRSPERMCADLIETPDEVDEILGELTELWIGIAQTILDIIPPFHGGYCTRMNMWAPDQAITPQNDVSTLVSPDMYEELILPYDRKIMQQFPFHCFHLHSTEHHQVEVLLKLEELTAFELTLEHTLGGPPLEVVLPKVFRILEQKPLMLCALDFKTAEYCIEILPPEGLCITLGIFDQNPDKLYDHWLEQQCAVGVTDLRG